MTALALDGPAVAVVSRVLERDLPAMPLADAVTRGLGAESWWLRLDDAGRLRGVVVLGPERSPVAPAPPPPPPPADPLDRLHDLPTGGLVAGVLGATRATGRDLADLALRHDDPHVRGEAVAVAVDAVLRDPALERTVLTALEHLDDGALARSVAGMAGDAAAGLLSVVVERARGRPLGARAARVAARLGAE